VIEVSLNYSRNQ